MKTKILITGANGQLGRSITDLKESCAGMELTGKDIDTLDLTDYEKLEEAFREYSPDYLVNCAAYTAVDKAEEEPEKAMKLNGEVPGKLAELSKKYNTTLIHLSTDYVFNGRSYIPYKETDPTGPRSAYGRSKLEGEKRITSSAGRYIIIRTSWLYSLYGHNFVKSIIRLAKERDKLKVVFDQIGSPTNAHDLAKAILDIIRFQPSGNPGSFTSGIFHFSNEGVCSWYDFAKEIIKIAELTCNIYPVESRDFPTLAERPFYSVMNKAEIKESYGLSIPYWRESLEKSVRILTEDI